MFSPALLHFSNPVMEELRDIDGVTMARRNNNNIRQADDMALIADLEQKLCNLADRRQEENTMIGLKIKI